MIHDQWYVNRFHTITVNGLNLYSAFSISNGNSMCFTSRSYSPLTCVSCPRTQHQSAHVGGCDRTLYWIVQQQHCDNKTIGKKIWQSEIWYDQRFHLFLILNRIIERETTIWQILKFIQIQMFNSKTDLDRHMCYESSLCALCVPLCFSLTLCCVWNRWETTVLLFHCQRALTDALSLQGRGGEALHHRSITNCLKQEDGRELSGTETEQKHRPLLQIWNHLTLNMVFGIFLHK